MRAQNCNNYDDASAYVTDQNDSVNSWNLLEEPYLIASKEILYWKIKASISMSWAQACVIRTNNALPASSFWHTSPMFDFLILG